MNKDANGFAFSRLNITYWAIESESKLWVWWHWHSQGSRSNCVDGHGLYCLSAAGWLNSVNLITSINKESTKWASRDAFVQRGLSEAKRYDCVSWMKQHRGDGAEKSSASQINLDDEMKTYISVQLWSSLSPAHHKSCCPVPVRFSPPPYTAEDSALLSLSLWLL